MFQNLQLPGRKAGRGVVLIAVLLLISLLTVLALGALEITRRHGHLARHSFELVQAGEFADSAIRLAILKMATTPPDSPRDSTPIARTLDVFGQAVSVHPELEAGRIDLNFANESLLTAAFAGNGFNEEDAAGLAQRIIDWRDLDDEVTGEQGAERGEYRGAGRSGPRNGPFENISELRQVLGADQVTDELLRAFTVYSHLPEVRRDAAVTPAINALRWAQAKQLSRRTGINSEVPAGAPVSLAPRLAGEVVRLRACASVENVQGCRIAIVRFTGNAVQPVLVLMWQTEHVFD